MDLKSCFSHLLYILITIMEHFFTKMWCLGFSMLVLWKISGSFSGVLDKWLWTACNEYVGTWHTVVFVNVMFWLPAPFGFTRKKPELKTSECIIKGLWFFGWVFVVVLVVATMHSMYENCVFFLNYHYSQLQRNSSHNYTLNPNAQSSYLYGEGEIKY